MALSFGSTCSDNDDGSNVNNNVCVDYPVIDIEVEAVPERPLPRDGRGGGCGASSSSSAIVNNSSSRPNNHHHRYEFPIESTLPAWCRKLRVWTLFPLTLLQQILLLIAAIQDFSLISENSDKIVPVHDDDFDGIRRTAIWVFFVTLLIDSLFLFAALYYGGVMNLSQIKQLWPTAGHHIGFSILTGRISFGSLDYVAGLCFVCFLSEFCVPLKLCVHYYFASSSAVVVVVKTKKNDYKAMISSSIWQLRLLFLDMFMSGACTFVAIDKYAILLGDTGGLLSTKTKRNYTIIISMAIFYWTLQLIGSSRVRLERLLHNLQQQQKQEGERTSLELVNCINNNDEDDDGHSSNGSS